LKRSKVILGRNTNSVEFPAYVLATDMTGRYVALDQKNKSYNVEVWTKLMYCCKTEAGRLATHDAKMNVILDQILAIEHCMRPNSARLAKDILRVTLEFKPILPRNPTDGIFPSSSRLIN